MSNLAGNVDLSTERLTSFELPKKRAILLLRWTLFGTLLALGAFGPADLFQMLLVDLILGIFLAVNLILTFLPLHTFRATPFEFSLGLLDTALISYVVYQCDPSGYLCLFYFILLIGTAGSTRISQILVGALTLSALYLLVVAIREGAGVLQSIPQLLVIPLFYSTALYFGYQVLQIRYRHAQVDGVYRERQELKIVLNILESITSSLDFHTVMFQIAGRIAEVIDAVRCSILLVEEGIRERAFVVAANDDQKLKMLPVDLAKYPEIQLAISNKRAVIIEDIEKSELLRPFVEELRKLNFRSLLVLPILYQEAVIGTLFLRASRARTFSEDELKFCRVVASAAASAIKNSMLYRSLEERAREQEVSATQIRGLLDNSPDLILQVDPDGAIREANRTVERVSGRPRAELLSLRVDALLRGLTPLAALAERARTSKGPLVCDAKLLAAHDHERDLSVTVGIVGETKGDLILIGRDVTEQKQATAMLQQTERLSSIGEIVASVAHELNNPLSGVLGFSQLLALKDTEGKFKRDIERIVECSDRCQKIVQNLLSFARPSIPEKKPLGLNGVLEKTLDLLHHSLQADNIEVVKDLDPGLPYVLADFHQVQQVFTNLITNAQQAMSADKGQGKLLLRTYPREGQVVLEIVDDGPGIPAEVLPRIFDPFFSTKKQGRGTGLGLSVSYGIVREHGGEIRVETRSRQGTTFSAVFPVFEGARTEEVSEGPVSGPETSGRNILVVDDEEVIVELYLQLLQALGHTIDTAATGLEALTKIQARDYDLVITDIKMPRMTGIQLYEKVLAIKPQMKRRFIFITGDMNSLSGHQFSTVTDNPCLLKPVNIEKIEATIRELLQDQGAATGLSASRN